MKKTLAVFIILAATFSRSDVVSNTADVTWSNLPLGITNAVYHNIYKTPGQMLSPERFRKLQLLKNQVRCSSTVIDGGEVVQKYVTSEKTWYVTNKVSYVFGAKMRDKIRERIDGLSLTNSVIYGQMMELKEKYTNSLIDAENLKTLNESLKSERDAINAKFLETSASLTNANLKISSASESLDSLGKKFPLAKTQIESIKAKLIGE